MARCRNIKPGFFTNDKLGDIQPLARLIFIGLWCHADREGRLLDRPKKIKAEILPYDNCDADLLLSELETNGFIERYQVENINYIQIVNFLLHQKPHVKESESNYPSNDKHQPRSVPAPTKEITSRPGSLLLDPGSLIPHPSNIMSGKPDNAELKKNAITVLDFLNVKTGKNFRPIDVNLDFIVNRLKSGATVQQCKTLIMRKIRDWDGNEEMQKYLRPSTLFNRTKFEQYLGEVLDPDEITKS